jgi:hypothetical protein
MTEGTISDVGHRGPAYIRPRCITRSRINGKFHDRPTCAAVAFPSHMQQFSSKLINCSFCFNETNCGICFSLSFKSSFLNPKIFCNCSYFSLNKPDVKWKQKKWVGWKTSRSNVTRVWLDCLVPEYFYNIWLGFLLFDCPVQRLTSFCSTWLILCINCFNTNWLIVLGCLDNDVRVLVYLMTMMFSVSINFMFSYQIVQCLHIFSNM